MHIVDGALTAELVTAGAVLGTIGTAIGLKTMRGDDLPRVAVMGAACFTATLIHVPIGPTSVHLILGGLAGLVLGWAIFPAMLVALVLDAVVAGFGGVTVLGTNLFNTAAPAVLVAALFRDRLMHASTQGSAAGWGFATGVLTLAMTAVMVASELIASGEGFVPAAQATVLAHLPVMVVEGVITASAAVFLRRVKPEILSRSGMTPLETL